MKTSLFFLAACFFALPAAQAMPRVGNGGGVWVCEDERPVGHVRWLRLVDLFEAENEFGYTVETGAQDHATVLREKLALATRLSPVLAQLLAAHPVDFTKVLHFIPKDSGLTLIEDAAIRVRPLPESCPNGYLYYGQLANFTFDGRLLVSSKFWGDPAFTETERGALLVHEAIYKALREGAGDKNSSRVRQIVGALFSTLGEAEQAARIAEVLAEPVPRR